MQADLFNRFVRRTSQFQNYLIERCENFALLNSYWISNANKERFWVRGDRRKVAIEIRHLALKQ